MYIALLIATCLIISGCGFMPRIPGITVKTELGIAISNVKDEWLKPCAPLPPAPETNNIGALLEDAAQVAAAGAECATRHNSFVDYLTPIVNKEKGTVK